MQALEASWFSLGVLQMSNFGIRPDPDIWRLEMIRCRIFAKFTTRVTRVVAIVKLLLLQKEGIILHFSIDICFLVSTVENTFSTIAYELGLGFWYLNLRFVFLLRYHKI